MKDIAGLVSGKLTALYSIGLNKHRNHIWMCSCECGNTKAVVSSHLTQQKVKTCGCSGKHSNKLEKGESAFNELFGRYKKQALSRGYSFELEKSYFREMTQLLCHYCGAAPSNKITNSGEDNYYVYTGVDRKDNTKGYTTDNVVPCCSVCNRAKNNMPYNDFTAWIDNLIKFTIETQHANPSNCH
jgi:hypothetical protein